MTSSGSRRKSPLSPLQTSIVRLAADGKTLREISAELNYSPKHIEHVLSAARSLVGAKNTTHLVRIAIENGWI